jgi:hypothetical protein
LRNVVDTTGDAVTGVLVAALARFGFNPKAAAHALPVAVTGASRSTEGYGALRSVPMVIDWQLESVWPTTTTVDA